MRVRITREAESDLESIHRHGAYRFGLVQAERYLAQLKVQLEFIGAYPEAARVRDEFRPPVRIVRWGSHVIIYRIIDGEVVVVRLLHGHQDWSAVL